MTSTISKLLLAAIGLSVAMGCTRTPEWTLFYVADNPEHAEKAIASANMVQTDFILGYFDTLEQCQSKGTGMLRLQGSSMPAAQAFVCAQQCQVDDNEQLNCQRQVLGGALDAL
ncbi:hypothetical protein [Shewanella ulleungensis]|jgi:hypothetical protein|uniref:Lipoprotein n=1 Tax=Shewanella ulleungensis TaxID=2282699 RepID=A0ABQ2QYL8_9GAMM|nr:hypothetical protein [Shewanella ulleungensis]MCL1152311.1 hypothetical protein [Shewanella ulleungensis]GGQ00886.1 lipoprotein [Shewanella ulleungensis]